MLQAGKIFSLLFLLILLSISPSFSQTVKEKEKELEAIKKELEKAKIKKETAVKEERKLLKELDLIDRKIDAQRKEIARIEKQLTETQHLLKNLTQEISETESKLAKLKRYLGYRLKQMYCQRHYSFWRMLFSAKSYPQLILFYRFQRLMAYLDAKAIRDAKVWLAKIERQKESISEVNKRLAEQQQVSLRLQEKYQEQQKEKTIFLAKVRNDKAFYERLIKEKEEAAAQLERLINQLRAQIAKREEVTYIGEPFAAMKGRLLWPVESREIITGFGLQQIAGGEAKILSKGLSIRTPIGSNVYAVHPGKVLFAQWFEGYGNMILIDHGKGYITLYAHLSDTLVSPGEEVGRGQVIGKTGDSDSLIGPQLYFEIRRNGVAIDPRPWLP